MSKPKLKLIGQDGNAFFILGKAFRVAKQAGWSQEQIEQFQKEATGSDYNNLLHVCMQHFDVY